MIWDNNYIFRTNCAGHHPRHTRVHAARNFVDVARGKWRPKLWLLEQCKMQNAVFCRKTALERITPYTFISHTKMSFVFGTGRSTKACQISQVHARSHAITNEPCTSSNYENTGQNRLLTTDKPQMLKKSRIVANRTLRMRQTTSNWIKRILGEPT